MVDIAVRCTLRAANGVTADNILNTFAVTGATPGTDDSVITDAFDDFYNLATTSGSTVSSNFNDTVLAANGLRVELISTPNVVPNSPYFGATYNLNPNNTAPLPQEACICLSMVTADYLTTPNPGRHRGRVYLGPLLQSSGDSPGANQPLRPFSLTVDTITEAASRLATDLSGGGRELAIWSRVDSAFRPVAGGWVDNEFDTQRRRGRERTSRQIWS